MTTSLIPRVLSTFRRHEVKALLMGGQACILYGGAEFSRDVDFAIAVSPGNLDRLKAALSELQAEQIFFPPLSEEALRRGHACHFRCGAPGLNRLRIDVMAKMRNAPGFERLWQRRTRMNLPEVGVVSLVSMPDLLQIKKTQRDKDWIMVRRMVEADVAKAGAGGKPKRVKFWLRECRTPELLCRLAELNPAVSRGEARRRPALRAALQGRVARVAREMTKEERTERKLDRLYWAPLRRELERWRMRRGMG